MFKSLIYRIEGFERLKKRLEGLQNILTDRKKIKSLQSSFFKNVTFQCFHNKIFKYLTQTFLVSEFQTCYCSPGYYFAFLVNGGKPCKRRSENRLKTNQNVEMVVLKGQTFILKLCGVGVCTLRDCWNWVFNANFSEIWLVSCKWLLALLQVWVEIMTEDLGKKDKRSLFLFSISSYAMGETCKRVNRTRGRPLHMLNGEKRHVILIQTHFPRKIRLSSFYVF